MLDRTIFELKRRDFNINNIGPVSRKSRKVFATGGEAGAKSQPYDYRAVLLTP